MKKFLSGISLIIITAVLICSCSSGSKFAWTEDALSFKSDSETVTLAANTHIEITEGSADVNTFGADTVSGYEGAFKTSANIGIGDSVKDFIKAYGVKYDTAMWETYKAKDETETIVNYTPYTNDMIDFKSFDDCFITVGFFDDEKGNWSAMTGEQLKAVWDLTAADTEYGDIAIISAGLDKSGNINEIICDYGSYADFKTGEEKVG